MRGQRLRVKCRQLFNSLNHSFPQRFASRLNPACLADFIAQISHLLHIACGISAFPAQIQHTSFRSQFNARAHFSQMIWMHRAIIFGADFAPIQIGNLHHLIVHFPYQRLSVRKVTPPIELTQLLRSALILILQKKCRIRSGMRQRLFNFFNPAFFQHSSLLILKAEDLFSVMQDQYFVHRIVIAAARMHRLILARLPADAVFPVCPDKAVFRINNAGFNFSVWEQTACARQSFKSSVTRSGFLRTKRCCRKHLFEGGAFFSRSAAQYRRARVKQILYIRWARGL